MIKKILKKIYLKANKLDCDENHMGTYSFWRLFCYNIFSLERIIIRIKYNQLNKNSKSNFS